MDWGRYLRATDAQAHLDVERLRVQHADKKIKSGDIPDELWEMIAEHERLVGDDPDDGRTQ